MLNANKKFITLNSDVVKNESINLINLGLAIK